MQRALGSQKASVPRGGLKGRRHRGLSALDRWSAMARDVQQEREKKISERDREEEMANRRGRRLSLVFRG